MTILTPSWNQNAGSVYTAQMMRYYTNVLLASSGTLLPRGGVNLTMGGRCVVTEDSPPSMNVRVASGVGAVAGTENALQGTYPFMNDGTVTLAIAASHATLNRIDIVIVRVRDSAFSGVLNNITIEVVTGTPASSPAIPSAPANSLILGQVLVGATVTTITNSVITDRRWPLSDTHIVRKTTDETVNNSTTFQDDDELRFPLNDVTGVRWAIDAFICFESTTVADIKFRATIPASAAFRGNFLGPAIGISGSTADGDFGASSTGATTSLGGRGLASTLVGVHLIGTASCSTSTPGELIIQWAQDTLDATNTRVTVNSWIRGVRLNS